MATSKISTSNQALTNNGSTNANTGAPAAQDDLATRLKKKIVDRLLELEKEGRDAVRDQYSRAVLNPLSSDATEKWQQGGERVATTSDELQQADRFPWIHPFFAAVAFESIYSGCVYVWLSAGKPDATNKILPSVDDYIGWQVDTFVTAIGANRYKNGGGKKPIVSGLGGNAAAAANTKVAKKGKKKGKKKAGKKKASKKVASKKSKKKAAKKGARKRTKKTRTARKRGR
jgi:hypothetical protein